MQRWERRKERMKNEEKGEIDQVRSIRENEKREQKRERGMKSERERSFTRKKENERE